jgi:hypothetical protein
MRLYNRATQKHNKVYIYEITSHEMTQNRWNCIEQSKHIRRLGYRFGHDKCCINEPTGNAAPRSQSCLSITLHLSLSFILYVLIWNDYCWKIIGTNNLLNVNEKKNAWQWTEYLHTNGRKTKSSNMQKHMIVSAIYDKHTLGPTFLPVPALCHTWKQQRTKINEVWNQRIINK